MTDKEFFERSLEISTEFDRYILSHPEVAEKIPREALIVFIVENDPEFSKKSMELARANRENNQPVVIVKVKGLIPAFESRLIEPKLELATKL